MSFNATIMAISSLQPNSPYSINETLGLHSINEAPGLHSINEAPGLHSIKETPGLLHSISTQRHTTFGDARLIPDQTPLSALSTYLDSKRLYVSSSRPSALT